MFKVAKQPEILQELAESKVLRFDQTALAG